MRSPAMLLFATCLVLSACSGESGSFLDQARSQREKYREKHVQLIREIRGLVYQADPIGPNHRDDYNSTIHAFVPQLKACKSAGDVRRVVHRAFTDKFGATLAGPEGKYDALSKKIWGLLDRGGGSG